MAAFGVLILLVTAFIWLIVRLSPHTMPTMPTRARKSKHEIDAEVEKFAAWLNHVNPSDFDFPERLSSRR